MLFMGWPSAYSCHDVAETAEFVQTNQRSKGSDEDGKDKNFMERGRRFEVPINYLLLNTGRKLSCKIEEKPTMEVQLSYFSNGSGPRSS